MARSLDARGLRPTAGGCGGRAAARADLNNQLCTAAAFLNQLQNSLNMVLLEPVDDKPVGRQEAKNAAIIDGLQWTNPGIKLLLR